MFTKFKYKYQIAYLDNKIFKIRYTSEMGTGFSPNGALKSAIRKFCRRKNWLFCSPTIIEIKLTEEK
jgi:hypothetical protein